MKRMHLVELEDLPSVPRVIRDGGTDFLDFTFGKAGFYRPLAPKLVALLEATGANHLVDLGSGGGGGALAMHHTLVESGHHDVAILFTDRHPNADARARIEALSNPSLRYHAEPVDALRATPSLAGVRTMFGALHHFRPDDVSRLVQASVDARMPFAFFDVAAPPVMRRLPAILAPVLALPNFVGLLLASLLVTPFLRPFRLERLLFTYVIPLIPLLIAWDGTVSALRAYVPEELLAIAQAVTGSEGYVIEAGRGGRALYLIGRPSR